MQGLFSKPKIKSRYFDFLSGLGYNEAGISRMNWRYSHIIEPALSEIKGARILDLGSHDGRWPSAYAEAGARQVIGLEGRKELVEKFNAYPGANKGRVQLRVGDFVEGMDDLVKAGETFDIVSCLGVYYHTMHHYRMMCQMASLRPKLIIIDSEFSRAKAPLITMVKENPTKDLNTIEQFSGQSFTPIGIPSLPAVRVMAESVGYAMSSVEWVVPEAERRPVSDYFDKWPDRVRGTVLLRQI